MLAQAFRDTARAVLALPLLLRDSKLDPGIRDAGMTSGGTYGQPYPFSVEEYQRLYQTAHVIYRCASLNAQSVAEGELRFYRSSSRNGGDEELPENHPLVKLFGYVNTRSTLHDLIESTVLYLELTGNSYWEQVRLSDKAPVVELYSMMSSRTKVVPGAKRVAGYTYAINGKIQRLEAYEVFHVLYPDPNDDWYGISPARSAARLIDADAAQIKAEKALWENRAAPSAIVMLEKEMQSEQMDYIAQRWKDAHAGPHNAGKTAFIAGAKSIQFMSLTPQEMQALERLRFTKGEIMQLYGVYPVIYGEVNESATRENAFTQRIEYHERTVKPKARRIQDALTERFVPTCGIKGLENVYAEFDYSETSLQKQLRTDQARANAPMVAQGVLTINDVREELGEEDVAYGDTWFGPISTVAIADESGAIEKPAPAPLPFPAPVKAPAEAPPPIAEAVARVVAALHVRASSVASAIEFSPRDPEVRRLRAVIRHILDVHGNEALADIGLPADYDPARADEWLDAKMGIFVETALNGHGSEIEDALSGADDKLAAVEEYFDERLVSAKMAARTEATGAANFGRLDAYTAAGLEETEWITSRDEAVRPSHVGVDGERIRIGDVFSNGLAYPGDPDGPLEEIAGCRCDILAVVPGAEQTASAKEIQWRKFAARLDGDERLIHREVRRLYEEQRRRAIAALQG